MFKRLLNVIAFLAVLILIVYLYEVLKPVPFPDVAGIGKIDADAPTRYSYTDEGIKYRVLRKGNGKFPKDIDMVLARKREELLSGELISDNFIGERRLYYRANRGPLSGISVMTKLVSEGGLVEAVLPPEQAFGNRGHRAAKTKNNSPLHVLLTLDEIREGYKATEPGPVDEDAPSEFSKTKSGLKYKLLRKSDGPKPDPKQNKAVVIHYTLKVKDGKQLKSTYEDGFAAEELFSDNNKWFTGFREGLQLIGVGGMIELEIPPALGYGNVYKPNAPPNSTLQMAIELMEIRDSREQSMQPLDIE